MTAKSKVAWPGVSTGGGNLFDSQLEEKLRNLLDEFGNTLVQDCKLENINLYTFPIFKPFNYVCYVTSQKVVYIFAHNQGGIASLFYMDLRNSITKPSITEMEGAVLNQLGWQDLSIISLPISILDADQTNTAILHEVSTNWIDNVKKIVDTQNNLVGINPLNKVSKKVEIILF